MIINSYFLSSGAKYDCHHVSIAKHTCARIYIHSFSHIYSHEEEDKLLIYTLQIILYLESTSFQNPGSDST